MGWGWHRRMWICKAGRICWRNGSREWGSKPNQVYPLQVNSQHSRRCIRLKHLHSKEKKMPYQTLRMGSYGDVVKTLQGALNLWPKSTKGPLTVDGAFGPKTDGKVREFQSGNSLVPDGVVGPMSWNALQPLVDQILSLTGPPKSDLDAGERIAASASSALSVFGWGGGAVVANKF